jgi:ribosome recycling factor
MDTTALDKAVNYFIDQIKPMHASTSGHIILEEVKCDVYNSKMKIRDLGTVNSLGGGTYVINLWDASVIEEVRKSIMNNLNLNPQSEGGALKVNFPPMTQEKRQDLVKLVSRYAEDCLIVIRNIRRDEISSVEKDLKEKSISEDEKKSLVSKIESIIKQYVSKVDDIKSNKITEINTI